MNEKQLEQQQVDETIQLIQLEETVLKREQAEVNQSMKEKSLETTAFKIRTGSTESTFESVVDYQQHETELLLKYQSLASKEKRLKALTAMAQNPYFARIDFTEDEGVETLYLGIASLRTPQEETIVIDWRAPIANLYYEGELGPAYYESHDEKHHVTLHLKRQFKIVDGKLLSMVDTSEIINDEFLLDILDEASSSKMKNIVSTIQKAQNAIIRDTSSKIMLIEGIAGSGKTSALLQRIAFLLYHHRKWLETENVLLFSPNHLFSDYISTVLPSLGESGVPTKTFTGFLAGLLPDYELLHEDTDEQVFLSGKENPVARLKTSHVFPQLIQQYSQSITDFGPLFRDLKLKGEVILSKEKIRGWYKQTNPELKMYQRMSLLQIKLLKKLGGIQKHEMHKPWVKEAVNERIDEVVDNDPYFEDTDENIRKLRKKLSAQLVKKQFRAIFRRIQSYQFVNYPKQYVHFLQSVTEQQLADYGITKNEWSEALQQLKKQLTRKTMTPEDATIFLLLIEQIYPFDCGMKARFIFIDEMQDFTPAQVSLLRSYFPRASYTFCGDLNQKVFGNESIVSSIDFLFSEHDVTKFQLTTSYRSTKQITDFANHFLSQEEQIKLTARDGRLPVLTHAAAFSDAVRTLQQQLTTAPANDTEAYWRTAIIAKTEEECLALYQSLDSITAESIQLIVSDDDFMKKQIILIPAFLAKGLEFDRVYGWNISEDSFYTEQDKLILYTIATRAMHELTLMSIGSASPLLKELDSRSYTNEA